MSRIYGSKNGIRQPRKSPPRDRKCIDCDNLILRRSPRCRSCAMKAKAPLSDEAREKIRNSLKGNKNWNWKGGSSKRAINERKASRPRPLNCEVCDRPEVELKRGLFYDHNHQTDKFRGWICSDCNLALGFAKDSVEIMKKLIKYVNKNDFNKPESNVEVGRHVLKGMLNGIARVSKAVRETYGGMGMNAVIEREISPGHEIVNDAQSIIQAIQVSDPLEKRGLNFLKELSD